MAELTRRSFNTQTVASLLTFSLLDTLLVRRAFSTEIEPLIARWLKQVNDLGLDLKGKALPAVQWQQQVEELFGKCELSELLRFIDFDKLTANISFRDQGEVSLRATIPSVEGLPTNLVFGHQVFALKKDRSVVPHGHENMATAFLVLRGRFHGRHFDRLEDAPEHMIIRPTIDRAFGAGEHSSISDEKDNVHWFKATSESAFIFNIHVNGLVANRRTGRVYIDPQGGEKLSDGRIKARKIGSDEVYRKYG
ncbi:MAG: hypothetical protein FJ295_03600 [Planctomycetes bacterium]|nr:hypothetical protein [Planctomycetota bacterium]